MDEHLNDKATQLWIEILSSNQLAFGELMQQYYATLFKYGYSLAPDDDTVKDCIQNVFLTIWRSRQSLKPITHVKFYLLKSLRREIYRHIKKEKENQDNNELFIRTVDQSFPATEDDLISKEEKEAMSKKVMEVMESLSKRQQEIIYLRYYMDMKPEQIAEIISLNRQSVYNLLSDALKRLKSKL